MKDQVKTYHFWLVLLATLIGATMASGLLTGATKVLQFLGIIQTVLSALGYRAAYMDQPPTGAAPAAPRNDRGRAAVGLLLALALVAACGALAKKVGYDALACARGQAPAAIADLVRQTESSLTGGAPSWSTFAEGELLSRGLDAAICAVEAAIADIRSAAAARKGQLAPRVIEADERACAWLAARRVSDPACHWQTSSGAGDGGSDLAGDLSLDLGR